MHREANIRDQAAPDQQEIKLPISITRKITVLLLCAGFSVFTALFFNHNFRSAYGGTARPDFAAIYYGARCIIHHQDPYHPNTFKKVFQAEGGRFSSDKIGSWVGPIAVAVEINLPTTLLMVTPLAFLPYAAAQAVWLLLTVVLLVISGYLIWSAGDSTGPAISGWLVGIVLANCQEILMLGNVAGIAVSLCVLASWCFLKHRGASLAVVLFALSLVIKPHDTGFVWLYFLLAGGVMRKRAFQTLALACVIGIAAAIWIAPVSPHWLHELHANQVAGSESGSVNDPSPLGVTSGNPGAILDLQTLLSVVWREPQSYNLASYLIAGFLIAAWAWTTIRGRNTERGDWLALGSIAALSLLPVYHRPHDAKLLLLAIPACAMMWREGGMRRWLSFAFTTLGVLFTSDLFMGFLVCSLRKPPFGPPVTGEKTIAVFLLPPAALLAMGCFYLFFFIRTHRTERASVRTVGRALAVSTAAAGFCAEGVVAPSSAIAAANEIPAV
jgi:hypothetical protein